MSKPTHPDVPDDIFTEEEETKERQWHVFLSALEPVEIPQVYEALDHTDLCTKLGKNDLMPESVQLSLVSFYHTGTYREAYVEAAKKCDYLNEQEDIPASEWEFERGSIMVAE